MAPTTISVADVGAADTTALRRPLMRVMVAPRGCAPPLMARKSVSRSRAPVGVAATASPSLTQIIFRLGARPASVERVRATDISFGEDLDELNVKEFCILRALVHVG